MAEQPLRASSGEGFRPSAGVLAVAALIAGAALLRSPADGRRSPRGEAPRRAPARSSARGRAPRRNEAAEDAALVPGEERREGGAAGRSGADDRGRGAAAPQEIPRGGWMDIGKRVFAEFNEDRLLMVAAGVTFYALLAIFPAIAAFVSLYGLFFSPEQVTAQIAALEGVLPQGALEVIGDEVRRVAGAGGGGLGLGFAIGLATALWSANAGMKAIFDALNIVYEEDEKRGFVKLTLVTLGFTLAAFLVVGLLVASVAIAPAVFAAVPLGGAAETAFNWLRWPIALVLIAALLATLYRHAPSREPAEWRWVAWGAGFGAVAWVIFSMLFTWYVSNFGSYNATYGSLGAVVGFMVWIWLSTTIVLLGAELNAEMEHQTARDTTTGPEGPMGTRGAAQADRVAS